MIKFDGSDAMGSSRHEGEKTWVERPCSDRRKSLLSEYLFETKSDVYGKMLRMCEKVSKSNVNILLVGESGVGKELAAKYIHLNSNRFEYPFVTVNCGAFSETLLESELFGHEKGAYTGATEMRKGRFEIANRGTFFLDEVGDVRPNTQIKLLRAIENKYIERIGSNTQQMIDFRLITATNRDLKSEVISGEFREDFFYRISTIVIRVPPLRERKEDLKLLINFFLEKSMKENGITITGMDTDVRSFLFSYDYPGNIRELKNIIDRMVVLSENGKITKDGVPIMYAIRRTAGESDAFNSKGLVPLKKYMNLIEATYLKEALGLMGGNVAETARQLEVSTRQLFNKIKKYKLNKKES